MRNIFELFSKSRLILGTVFGGILFLNSSLAYGGSISIDYGAHPGNAGLGLWGGASPGQVDFATTPAQTGEKGDWTITTEEDYIPIIVNGITIVIPKVKSVVASHPVLGESYVENGVVQTVTRKTTAVYKSEDTVSSYKLPPTLFVLIGGARGLVGQSGSGLYPWVYPQAENKLRGYRANDSQKVIMKVDWNSMMSNTRQVPKLANRIRNFLAEKNQDWDVVVLGHSRGGIFAHELSGKLTRMSKIRKLYTILLDPTAAVGLGDRFPGYKYDSNGSFSGPPHKAYNFYDDNDFFAGGANNIITITSTFSDNNIPGYTDRIMYNNRLLNDFESHDNFAAYYIAEDFETELAQIYIDKGPEGSYPAEGEYSVQVDYVKISAPKQLITANMSASVNGGNVTVDGEISIGQLVVNVNFEVGADGVNVGINAAVVVANIAMSDEGISISASGVANTAVIGTIDRDGLVVDGSVGPLGGGVVISQGRVEVSGRINGVGEVEVGTSGGSVSVGGSRIISW